MCEKSSGFSSKLSHQIRRKMAEVEKALALPDGSHIQNCFLVHSSGKILFEKPKGSTEHEDVPDLAQGLQETALQLAETLGEERIGAIHIKGSRTLISCFSVGVNLLVIFSGVTDRKQESMNLSQIDDRMKPLMEELNLLLGNVLV